MNKAIFTRLFHSTSLLERKPRTFWESRCNHYSRRFRRLRVKQTLLRDVDAYAQFMFQSWKEDIDEDDPSPSQGPSWFRKQYSPKGSRRHRNGNQGSKHWVKRDHEFCKDDFDVETVFRSSFGGNRFFYWSFINEENPQWRRSGGFSNHGKSWNWRHRSENEYGSSTESESEYSYSDLVSDRLALGLSASGPLKLEDVKNAYRICALKWHPDRHHGSSKVIAEEKFKHCSAAYQSLCDKLALD
ncbi:Chaperone protein DnaJ [Spatholobus suberectus]|nr:Chaperone protein DnaJ [Spatholobus suberectus]